MLYYFIYFYVFIILIIISYIDIKSKIVPDKLCLMIIAAGFPCAIFDKNIIPHIKGFAVMLIINLIIAITTKGLGGGDVKLFSALGFVFKLKFAFEIYILSFITSGIYIIIKKIIPIKALIKLRNSKEIAFVPFITISFFLTVIKRISEI